MLPQRVLTSALLSELQDEQGGGGGQQPGIMEVMPPHLEQCPGWVVLSTKTGRGMMLSACD